MYETDTHEGRPAAESHPEPPCVGHEESSQSDPDRRGHWWTSWLQKYFWTTQQSQVRWIHFPLRESQQWQNSVVESLSTWFFCKRLFWEGSGVCTTATSCFPGVLQWWSLIALPFRCSPEKDIQKRCEASYFSFYLFQKQNNPFPKKHGSIFAFFSNFKEERRQER